MAYSSSPATWSLGGQGLEDCIGLARFVHHTDDGSKPHQRLDTPDHNLRGLEVAQAVDLEIAIDHSTINN